MHCNTNVLQSPISTQTEQSYLHVLIPVLNYIGTAVVLEYRCQSERGLYRKSRNLIKQVLKYFCLGLTLTKK